MMEYSLPLKIASVETVGPLWWGAGPFDKHTGDIKVINLASEAFIGGLLLPGATLAPSRFTTLCVEHYVFLLSFPWCLFFMLLQKQRFVCSSIDNAEM